MRLFLLFLFANIAYAQSIQFQIPSEYMRLKEFERLSKLNVDKNTPAAKIELSNAVDAYTKSFCEKEKFLMTGFPSGTYDIRIYYYDYLLYDLECIYIGKNSELTFKLREDLQILLEVMGRKHPFYSKPKLLLNKKLFNSLIIYPDKKSYEKIVFLQIDEEFIKSRKRNNLLWRINNSTINTTIRELLKKGNNYNFLNDNNFHSKSSCVEYLPEKISNNCSIIGKKLNITVDVLCDNLPQMRDNSVIIYLSKIGDFFNKTKYMNKGNSTNLHIDDITPGRYLMELWYINDYINPSFPNHYCYPKASLFHIEFDVKDSIITNIYTKLDYITEYKSFTYKDSVSSNNIPLLIDFNKVGTQMNEEYYLTFIDSTTLLTTPYQWESKSSKYIKAVAQIISAEKINNFEFLDSTFVRGK